MKNKNIILKIAIAIIALVIIGVLVIFFNKVSIIKKLNTLSEQNDEITNFHYVEKNPTYTSEYFRKDNIIKVVVTLNDDDFNAILFANLDTNEQYDFYPLTKQYAKLDKVYLNKELRKVCFYGIEQYNPFKLALEVKISNVKYDDKNCYKIRWGNITEIIDKETGNVLSSSNGSDITYTYEIGTVENIEMPNLNDYTYVQK